VTDSYDLLIVGGGINGVAIARDAAGRGLRVLLCDKGDLAGATSSASSKLVHGGLRYLEHGDFRLVRESLAEREVLLRLAPYLVRPMSFVLPQGPGSRPGWLVRAGLFLYDRLGGARSLPGARALDLRQDPLGRPLRAPGAGFVYADCRVDDARLTVVTARDAAARGAVILTRTALVAAQREPDSWRAGLQHEKGERHEVAARVLVNAAGPWVADVLRRAGLPAHRALRLVKGSHIVVPRLYEGEHAYLLQNDDGRIVFVIPFERAFSLIGTTELPFTGDPATAAISEEEIAYLCRAVARWFAKPHLAFSFDVRFYAINPGGPSIHLNESATRAQNSMQQIADATGGTAYVPENADALATVFRQIANELRAQYLLQYYSNSNAPNGKYLTIKVTSPTHPDLRIRARQGYYAKK